MTSTKAMSWSLLDRHLAIFVATCASLFAAEPSRAQNILPSHGVVSSGAATINQNGSTLTINQGSARAVVDWNGFSVGPQNQVVFAQPGASSAILNRVTGSAPSTLAGQIEANGQVFLINPNGVAITPSGAVKVGGGFVASSLDIANSDFNNGNLRFSGTGASAPVSNAGSLQVAPGGFLAMFGGSVSNSGLISVPLGKVGLGSGEQATLNLTGDNFLQVAMPTQALAANGKALVDVSGHVSAAGGTVALQAATVAHAIYNAVNVPGTISASSARASGGSIILGGGDGGNVAVSGQLRASGARGGGSISVTGHDVTLSGAKAVASSTKGKGGSVTVTGAGAVQIASSGVDASGATGGGQIHIGGTSSSATDRTRAVSVNIDPTSNLVANATSNGDGGSVSVWSTNLTSFSGRASANGGVSGGNGGLVETSSAGQLSIGANAFVQANALKGAAGLWLIDPPDLTIDAAAAVSISNALNGGTDVTEQTTLTSTSGFGVVNAGGSGNIIVDTFFPNVGSFPISWTTTNTLTLNAYNSIFIQSTRGSGPVFSGFSGHLVLRAGADIIQETGGAIQALTLSATATSGKVVLTDPANDLVGSVSGSAPLGFSFSNQNDTSIGGIVSTSGTVRLESSGGITQTGAIVAPALSAVSIGGAAIILDNSGNSIGTLAGLTTGSEFHVGGFSYHGTSATLAIGSVAGYVSTATDTPAVGAAVSGIAIGEDQNAGVGVSVVNAGNLTLNNGIQMTFAPLAPLTPYSVVLAATGSFTNNVGAGAITWAGSAGRWNIYSSAPTGDTFGNLNSSNTAVWNSSYSSANPLVSTGDRYVFAFQPTVTFTSGNLGKTYGTDVTSAITTDYTVSGIQPAVAGAYLGDNSASVYSGAPTVTSAGSAANASASGSPYVVNVASGAGSAGVLTFDNYAAAYVSSGRLTVSPLALTYAVANANSTYGTAATLGAATLTGVLFGDAVNSTVGAFSGGTPVAVTSNTSAGSYSEQVTALSNPNYSIAATGNTLGQLTIAPLALTYAVADAHGTFGTTATLGAATLTGVLANDTVNATVGAFTGATPVALSPTTPVGKYSERVTSLSNPNYFISPNGDSPGVLTIDLQIRPGQTPGPYSPPAGPSWNGFLDVWPSLATTCSAGPQLPDPNRYSDPEAALRALSKAMTSYCERCSDPTLESLSAALEKYAAALRLVAPRLPPQLRNLPDIVEQAARKVRSARSISEAVGALSTAIQAVNKDIALLRAENPDTAPAKSHVGVEVGATLEQVKIKLLRISEL